MTPPTPIIEYRRALVQELRVEQRAASEPRSIVGHAAVFDREYPIGPAEDPYWIERVTRGAFLDTIQADDIRALFNHDANLVLGRNRSGSLTLREDEVGLEVRIVPDLENTQVRDVFRMIERGDVSQMSIGMRVRSQQWDLRADGVELRTIMRAMLFDVSPVTYPASASTEVAVRSGLDPEAVLAEVRAERARSATAAGGGDAGAVRAALLRHDALVTATL